MMWSKKPHEELFKCYVLGWFMITLVFCFQIQEWADTGNWNFFLMLILGSSISFLCSGTEIQNTKSGSCFFFSSPANGISTGIHARRQEGEAVSRRHWLTDNPCLSPHTVMPIQVLFLFLLLFSGSEWICELTELQVCSTGVNFL